MSDLNLSDRNATVSWAGYAILNGYFNGQRIVIDLKPIIAGQFRPDILFIVMS